MSVWNDLNLPDLHHRDTSSHDHHMLDFFPSFVSALQRDTNAHRFAKNLRKLQEYQVMKLSTSIMIFPSSSEHMLFLRVFLSYLTTRCFKRVTIYAAYFSFTHRNDDARGLVTNWLDYVYTHIVAKGLNVEKVRTYLLYFMKQDHTDIGFYFSADCKRDTMTLLTHTLEQHTPEPRSPQDYAFPTAIKMLSMKQWCQLFRLKVVVTTEEEDKLLHYIVLLPQTLCKDDTANMNILDEPLALMVCLHTCFSVLDHRLPTMIEDLERINGVPFTQTEWSSVWTLRERLRKVDMHYQDLLHRKHDYNVNARVSVPAMNVADMAEAFVQECMAQ